MNFIAAYCRITDAFCEVTGKFLKNDQPADIDILKQLYKELQIDYPKFYKMDTLSKSAFIGTELLKEHLPYIENYKDDEIALIFSNSGSSADTDKKFYHSYSKEGAPSPALLVYTLPNILIGEIAIRNKWFGENLFTVSSKFNGDFFENYCNLILSKNSNACMCGYIEALEDKIDAFLFFVEKSDKTELNLPLTSKILANLYKR